MFLGYSKTTKGYKLFKKVNKKFLFARDAMFLEISKGDNVVEQKLEHLDQFTYEKHYFEVDYEIINIEGGYLYWINL